MSKHILASIDDSRIFSLFQHIHDCEEETSVVVLIVSETTAELEGSVGGSEAEEEVAVAVAVAVAVTVTVAGVVDDDAVVVVVVVGSLHPNQPG